MAISQRDTKAWIKAVAAHLNLSLSELALKSGVAASTVTRYINDLTGTIGISQRTLDAIATFSGFRPHQMPGLRRPMGLGEPEAVPYQVAADNDPYPAWVETAIAAAKAGKNGVEAWVMRTAALDLLGVLAGDILMIDQNRRPRSGDIVCAQLTDLVTGSVETVMRRYDPPYIVTHSAKMGPARPEPVDDERVIVMGVSIGVIRPRH